MGQGSDPLNDYNDVSPVDRTYESYDRTESDDTDYRAAAQEIEADIEQTRAQMSETINQIQERLNPHNLAEQAKEAVYDATIGSAVVTAKGMGSNMFETIKQNPLPAAIAVLSIGWLMRKSTTIQSDYNSSQGQYRPYPQPGYQNYGQTYGGQTYAARYASPGANYYNESPNYYNQGSGYYNQGYSQQQSPGIGERVTDAAGNVVDTVQHAAGSVVGGVQHAAGSVVGGVQNVAGSVAGGVQYAAGTVVDAAGNVVDAAGNVVGNVVDGVQHVAGTVANQVDYLGDQAREQAHYASHWFQRTLNENPLAVGAAVMIAGTVVGMTMPSTPVENRFMGEARDTLVERVQETAQETMEKVQAVASEATQVVQEKVQSAVSDTTEAVQDTVKLSAREQGLTS